MTLGAERLLGYLAEVSIPTELLPTTQGSGVGDGLTGPA